MISIDILLISHHLKNADKEAFGKGHGQNYFLFTPDLIIIFRHWHFGAKSTLCRLASQHVWYLSRHISPVKSAGDVPYDPRSAFLACSKDRQQTPHLKLDITKHARNAESWRHVVTGVWREFVPAEFGFICVFCTTSCSGWLAFDTISLTFQ